MGILLGISCGILLEITKLYIINFKILKLSIKSYKEIWLISFVCVFVNCVLFMMKVPVAIIASFLVAISVVGSNIFLLKNKKQWIFVVCVYVVICVVDMLIASLILNILSIPFANTFPFSAFALSLNIPSLILIVLIYIFINFYKKISGNQDFSCLIRNVYLVLLNLVFFVLYLSSMIIVDFNKNTNNSRGGVTAAWVGGLMLFMICIINLIFAYKNEKNKQKNQLYMNLLDSQKNYYETTLKGERKTKAFRHDILNHLLCINSLIKSDLVKSAEEYIEKLIGEIKNSSNCVKSGNVIMDIIINNVLSVKSDIQFIIKGEIPENLKINNIDLCILFSNLLNNAIEALDKVEKNKYIILTTNTFNQNIHFKLQNSYKDHIDFANGLPLSKKKNNHHGFGSRNIQDVVLKYAGRITYETGNDTFVVSIVIPDIMNLD